MVKIVNIVYPDHMEVRLPLLDVRDVSVMDTGMNNEEYVITERDIVSV